MMLGRTVPCPERPAPWMEGLLWGLKTQPGGIEATARNVLNTARNVVNMVSRKTGQATRKLRPWTAKQPAVRIDGAGRLPEEWQRYDRSPVHPRPSAPGRLSPGLNGCALTAWLFERV